MSGGIEEEIKDCEYLDQNFYNSNDIKPDFTYKIIVLGNSNVGKSCISLRLSKGVFEDKCSAT